MKVGDKCRYKSNHNNVGCWDNYGVVVSVKGKVHTIRDSKTNNIVNKVDHMVWEVRDK